MKSSTRKRLLRLAVNTAGGAGIGYLIGTAFHKVHPRPASCCQTVGLVLFVIVVANGWGWLVGKVIEVDRGN